MTYNDLRERIGDKLGYGYDSSMWSASASKSDRVEKILTAALSRFYDLAPLPGERDKHQWSFLFPTITLDLVAGQYAYDLPTNFAMFNGPLIYAPGTNDWYEPIKIMGAEYVQTKLTQSDTTALPRIAGVRIKAAQDIHQTVWELIVAPIPDANYQVKASIKINPTVPGATGDVPLGGQPHDLTLIEACLAECEMFDELSDLRHNARFVECLRGSVSHDRQVSSAHTLGYNGDPSVARSWRQAWVDDVNIPAVTYLGSADW